MKGGEEKKAIVALLVFIIATFFDQKKMLDTKGLFGDNVIKNPARYIYTNIIGATFDIATFGQILAFFGNVSENLEYLVMRPSCCLNGI